MMEFESLIQYAFNKDIRLISHGLVTGGSINKTYWLETSEGKFFLKYNDVNLYPEMLQKEANGLIALQQTNTIRVPKVLTSGTFGDHQFLIFDFIEKGYRTKYYWENFASQMAALHQHTSTHFGFHEHNYIGSLPQMNTPENDWIKFFVEQRLMVQAVIAMDKGLVDKWLINKLEVLAYKLPAYINKVKPALLHGDLWHGNYMIAPDGEVVVYDPAVYYGCSEMEIAFTELFGRMDDRFYYAYFEQNPSEEGYELRADIYNLYPLFVHLNLFGQSYLAGIENVLARV